ncbi:hypothetical protein PPL_06834 [Heterostelium album PN500]|uniref:Uncharacterized protein n=1 Tax=Heterostelium pallidum (strain ATCC 26659 / Pp 5 / PN500) TaxID=670386 RepID=D3BDN2_HETP5|nr:hypothetical protein PPL_06834 [Heterostelium album PN500]EFA80013.1 hypothetical protein PPL_06834 [Heterostelium album PN500]|eukprot:XP_020432133.1 hypothetical protein PPL_06834 [Heterostelium album PN500]
MINLLDDTAERVFHDEGLKIGKIVTFNSKSKILSFPSLPHKEFYESTSNAVGRIFIKYRSKEDNDKVFWYTKTGFCIKRDTVITSCLAIEELNFEKVYIFFGCDATVESEIDLTHLDEFGIELVSCGRAFDALFRDPIILKGSDDHLYSWLICNDIEILQFKGEPPIDQQYLLPMIPTKKQTTDYYVMGYPGHIDLKQFADLYGERSMKYGLLYVDVHNYTRGFQRKTIFIGEALTFDEKVITHQCPTFKGTAGGILADSEYDKKFIGIHIGGTKEVGNVALSVTHPVFWHVYKTYVLDGDPQFLNENRAELEPFLNYFKFNQIKR